jgi:hypothetical protein
MLRGSPYSYLVAVNGKSLSLADQERGRQKLEEVTKQRQSESPQQQEERIRKYQKDRERDHLTMEQLVTPSTLNFWASRRWADSTSACSVRSLARAISPRIVT